MKRSIRLKAVEPGADRRQAVIEAMSESNAETNE